MTRHEELLAEVTAKRDAIIRHEQGRRRLMAELDMAVYVAYLHGVPVVRIVEAGRWATRKSVRDALLRQRARDAKEF